MDDIILIKVSSFDGLDVGMLESASDRDVAYPIFEGFSRVVFDPGGECLQD